MVFYDGLDDAVFDLISKSCNGSSNVVGLWDIKYFHEPSLPEVQLFYSPFGRGKGYFENWFHFAELDTKLLIHNFHRKLKLLPPRQGIGDITLPSMEKTFSLIGGRYDKPVEMVFSAVDRQKDTTGWLLKHGYSRDSMGYYKKWVR